jgi:hypothetical protein
VEFAKPPIAPASELFNDADDTDAPHQYHRVADLLGPDATDAGPVEHLFLTSVEEPASVAEAEQDPCWGKVMLEEMTSIEDNETWELVDLPHGHRPIGLKWVFKAKHIFINFYGVYFYLACPVSLSERYLLDEITEERNTFVSRSH